MDFVTQPEVVTAATQDDMNGKYLTFFLEEQLFGLPIASVVQIVGMQPITSVPDYPDYAKGIINIRGEVIPVMDMRTRFHKIEQVYDDRTCIVITQIGSHDFGLIVDRVDEVTDIEEANISQVPSISGSTPDQNLTGIAQLKEKTILLVNERQVVGDQALYYDN